MEKVLITVTYNPGTFAAEDLTQLFIVNVQDPGDVNSVELHEKAAMMFMDWVCVQYPKWIVREITPVPVISVEASKEQVVTPVNA